MKLKLFTLAAAAAMVAACTANASDRYTVTAKVPEKFDGLMAYLVNFDTGEKIDSTAVKGTTATFEGSVAAPTLARLIIDGNRMAQFALENAPIAVDNGTATGSDLNKRIQDIMRRRGDFEAKFRAMAPDSTGEPARQAIMEAYEAYTDSIFRANANNLIGYQIFLERAYGMDLDQLKAALAENPGLKQYTRVGKLLTAAQNKAATQPGNKFVDFTIKNDSITQSLSDYVGKGKPVLVDFWASWCGPCIRETKVIKQLLEEWGPKGFEVLGVAVWDEPDNTRRAIERHKLPWPQIINAQTVPTDLYGITGIPTILIIGPDGTILSRDKQDDELRAEVKAVMEGTLTPDSLKVQK